VNAQVEVPIGENTVEVLFESNTTSLALVDVEICAAFDSNEVCNTITVVPASYPASLMSIEPSGVVGLTTGVPRTFEVRFDVPVFVDSTALTFSVADEAIVPAPANVAVEWGAAGAMFTVTPAAAGETTIVVNHGASSVSVDVVVTDVPQVAKVMITEVFYNHSGTDSGYEWIKLYNGGSVAQDLGAWSIANAGVAWTGAKWGLSGTIPAGGCLVVGGPIADAENDNPTYGLVLDFDPDLQNSGTATEAADGVAIFDTPVPELVAGSIPVDVVIYGGVNSNSLTGPDGNVAPVDVANAPSGSSIARTSDSTWEVRSTPTPNLCPPW